MTTQYHDLTLAELATARDNADRAISQCHADAEDATAGMSPEEKAAAADAAARICRYVCLSADLGEVGGVVTNSEAWQLAVLRLALKTTEAMSELHGAMAETTR